MAQAIARCRRYGQRKKVHIYHFAALSTIDIDILEHRHKRSDALKSPGCPIQTPPKFAQATDKEQKKTKVNTRMVRAAKNTLALVPVSWLEDEQARKSLGVKGDEVFKSLIHFSETFEDDN